MRISMLHAALRHDDLEHNLVVLEQMYLLAQNDHPDLVLTPELAVSGYEFFKQIGVDWIQQRVPQILERFSNLARKHQTALVLGTPRYDERSGQYHNAAVFIDRQGQILGEHYKFSVLPGSEAWSRPGVEVKTIPWKGHTIGLAVCSDLYFPRLTQALSEQKITVLISPANWAPGMHGPEGEWEQRSLESGLCLMVCNRTGAEDTLDFRGSASVVVAQGRRMLEYTDPQAAILSFEVRSQDMFPRSEAFEITPFEFTPLP